MKREFAAISLAALLILTSACGQTGPDKNPAQQEQAADAPLKKEVAVSELCS